MSRTFAAKQNSWAKLGTTGFGVALALMMALGSVGLSACSSPEDPATIASDAPVHNHEPPEKAPPRPALPSDRITTITPVEPPPLETQIEEPPPRAEEPADPPQPPSSEEGPRPEPTPPVVIMAEPVETVTDVPPPPGELEEPEETAAVEQDDPLDADLGDAKRRAEAARQEVQTQWAQEAAHTTIEAAEAHMADAAQKESTDPLAARVAYELAAALYGEALQMADAAAQADAGAAAARAAALEVRDQITEEVRSLAQQEAVAGDTAWNAAEEIPDAPEQATALYEVARNEYAKALRVAAERAAEAETDAARAQQELETARERAQRARSQLTEEMRQQAPDLVAEAEALWNRATQAQEQDPARAVELFEQARAKCEEAEATVRTAQRQAFVEELRGRAVTVAQDGTGDYESINEAIRAVPPDTPIFIRPGVYREAVVIDRPVALIGEGPVSEIRIESTDADCITIQTSQAVIHGLTLRSSASFDSPGVYTVYCPRGRVLIEYCDIATDSLSAIAVHNAGTAPIIRGCNIHDSTQAGIFFYDGAEGIVEDCEIAGNGLAGIQIKSGANPVIRQNKIRQNKGSGVFVNDGGLGVIENNEITQNALAGISIATGGNPTVRQCSITNNRRYGVRVYDQGRGTIEDCTLAGNEPENWLIGEGSEVIRANNRE